MTTIAIDVAGNIAADGRVTGCNEIVRDDMEKVLVRHGRIYAITGCTSMFDAVIAWHNAGADPGKTPPYSGEMGWVLIVIQEDGLFCYTNKVPHAMKDEYRLPVAWGTGESFALGAMLAGKSAKEAVEIACRVDAGSGGRIKCLSLADVFGPKLKEAAE